MNKDSGSPSAPDPLARVPEPELIPLNQGWSTEWLVSCKDDAEADPENPYAGWFEVKADGRTGTVEFCGNDLTPTEARNLAAALIEAARHAEGYWNAVLGVLTDEEFYVDLDLGPEATIEQKRAVHAWFRAAHRRVADRRPRREVGHDPQ